MSEERTEHAPQVWRGADVSLAEVLARLNRLRVDAARKEIGDQDHIHPRNSVLALVVVASTGEDAERAAGVVAELAAHHPCRAVIVLDEPGGGKGRIDATVTSLTHALVDGAACQYEEVFLRVQGAAAEHIPSLVEPFVIPDVTTYVWWTGSPPIRTRRFEETLEAADVVLLDSSCFERPFDTFAAHAELAGEQRGVVFGDFHWTRLAPWRETLAQFFNPPSRTGFLGGIGAVGVEYVADGRGNRTAAALLAGWLGSSLGWKPRRAAAGKGGVVAAHFTSRADHPVEVAMKPVELEGFAPGEITAVRVEAVSEGRTCRVEAVRHGYGGGHVAVDAEVGGTRVPRSMLPMPPHREPALLSRLLVEARSDRHYRPALRLGAEVLRSARA